MSLRAVGRAGIRDKGNEFDGDDRGDAQVARVIDQGWDDAECQWRRPVTSRMYICLCHVLSFQSTV